MIIISVTDLALRFGTTTILENISFSLDEKDKLGIIGVNGSGKSSLFKMITGEYEHTEGEVYLSKGKTLGILTQEGAFAAESEDGNEDESALVHMYHAFPALLRDEARLTELERRLNEGMDAAGGQEAYDILTREFTTLNERFIADGGLEFRGRCLGILRRLGFDDALVNMPVRHLSGGQRTRLALGIQLSREPDVLLLDEPTNHLDIETLGWLEHYLSDYKGCVMIISHDRYFLDRVTNKTLCIQNHKAKLYNGGYTQSMEQREIDRALAEKHYKDQQKEIARQEAYIAQQKRWNRERNIIAAESRQKMLDRIVRLEKPENAPTPIKLRFTASRQSGNEVLDLRGVTMGFGERILFSDLNFLVKRDDHLFILGQNGCGKSTLIKLIIGKLEPLSGVIEAGYNVEIGYYDQENQNLTPENTVLEELWSAYPKLTETEIRNRLAQFRFIGEDVYKEVSVLSGGERARLTLCKLILSKMNLLVLDEPTNHLDIDSREALEAALTDFEGTIIAVSHDRYFIEKLATRMIEITPGVGISGVTGEADFTDYHVDRPGEGYTEYRRFMENRRTGGISPTKMGAAAVEDSTPSTAKEDYEKAKRSASDERKRQNRIKKLTDEAEALEKAIDEIDAEMNGEAATDFVRVAELDTLKTQKEERLMEVYEELEELQD